MCMYIGIHTHTHTHFLEMLCLGGLGWHICPGPPRSAKTGDVSLLTGGASPKTGGCFLLSSLSCVLSQHHRCRAAWPSFFVFLSQLANWQCAALALEHAELVRVRLPAAAGWSMVPHGGNPCASRLPLRVRKSLPANMRLYTKSRSQDQCQLLFAGNASGGDLGTDRAKSSNERGRAARGCHESFSCKFRSRREFRSLGQFIMWLIV